MSRFAPVCPPWLARKLDEIGMLGGYHLLLAHDIVAKPDEYGQLFGKTFRKKNPSSYIILDNSMIELGHPCSTEDILDAVSIVEPNAVVLPDYAHDCERTIEESTSAYKAWRSHGINTFMCVAQGNTEEEYVKCATALVDLTGVDVIGIPRNAVSKLHSRFRLTCSIYAATRRLIPEIHLLGFSDDVMDDITCASLPFVRGIDSTTPLRAGLDNVWLASPHSYEMYEKPRGDYWNQDREITAALVQNLQRVRSWLQTPYN
jgi:hypothetical protein